MLKIYNDLLRLFKMTHGLLIIYQTTQEIELQRTHLLNSRFITVFGWIVRKKN